MSVRRPSPAGLFVSLLFGCITISLVLALSDTVRIKTALAIMCWCIFAICAVALLQGRNRS